MGKAGRNLIQQGAGGCPPFLDVDMGIHPDQGFLRCYGRTAPLYAAILNNPTIRTVYLSFHHSAYFRNDIPLHDVTGGIAANLPRKEFLQAVIVRTIDKFKAAGKSVVILYDMPELNRGEPLRCLSAPSGSTGGCDHSKVFTSDFGPYDVLLEEVTRQTGVRVFRTQQWMEHFPRESNGDWLYRDETHLSLKGSLFFADKFDF